jgi:EgtB-related family protein
VRWQRRDFGQWVDCQAHEPATHLSLHEAQAWCRWAGRRLPSEAQWRTAQAQGGDDFRWGEVWEWTATPFGPFDGFTPHPYRDYSAPWFDGRPVLKGASLHTLDLMRHADYRNFYEPQRDDVFAGFRSCARP